MPQWEIPNQARQPLVPLACFGGAHVVRKGRIGYCESVCAPNAVLGLFRPASHHNNAVTAAAAGHQRDQSRVVKNQSAPHCIPHHSHEPANTNEPKRPQEPTHPNEPKHPQEPSNSNEPTRAHSHFTLTNTSLQNQTSPNNSTPTHSHEPSHTNKLIYMHTRDPHPHASPPPCEPTKPNQPPLPPPTHQT